MSLPHQGSDENSGTRRDGSQSPLAGRLKQHEERLRKIVDEFDLDPEKIEQGSLDSVKKVIKRIYKILKEDAETQNSMLANTEFWDSMKVKYQEVFAATSNLRPIFKRFDELSQYHGRESLSAELVETTKGMVNGRKQWLAELTEFQNDFSAFYNELIHSAEGKSA